MYSEHEFLCGFFEDFSREIIVKFFTDKFFVAVF